MSENPAVQDDYPSGPATQAAGPARLATLARDLADFLVEFSIVLHKRTLYPPGHPYLQESAARFVDRLESLLENRESLTIGVAHHQLIIGGVATDPRNALLSDLARRLHRQRIASIGFRRGLKLEEIEELLRRLTGELEQEGGPLGLRLERAPAWPHIQLRAPELGRLLLDPGGEVGHDEAPQSGSDLWLGLANLALSADGQGSPQTSDPLVLARAIDEQVGQVAYDRVVLDTSGKWPRRSPAGQEPGSPERASASADSWRVSDRKRFAVFWRRGRITPSVGDSR